MADKIFLTNRDLVLILSSLKALDGVVDGQNVRRFDYTTETYWQIVKVQTVIGQMVNHYERAKEGLLMKYELIRDEPVNAENRERAIAFNAERIALDAQGSECELTFLDRKKLEEKNQKFRIPPSVMTSLMPILLPVDES